METPSLSRRHGVGSTNSKSRADSDNTKQQYDYIDLMLSCQGEFDKAKGPFRTQIRHSLTLRVTARFRQISGRSRDRGAAVGQGGSRSESRYLALVDLVDLIGVEKLLGVTQVDLLANEYVEQVRVDVSVQPEVSEDLQRFGKRFATLVRPVLGS